MWSKLIKSVSVFVRKLIVAYQKMTINERRVLVFLVAIVVLSVILVARASYYEQFQKKPAIGGLYKEGVIGEPEHINPLLAVNGAEKTLVRLTYRSLFEYNQKGIFSSGLAKKLTVNKERTRYLIQLKQKQKWSDGEEITARDVLATIRKIKDAGTRSHLQESWLEVKPNVLSKYKIELNLRSTNAVFKEVLTLPIMPAHIIDEIEADKFSLHAINQEPVSSGPYLIDNIVYQNQIAQVFLSANPEFNGDRPYINKLVVHCYPDYDSMIEGLSKGQVSGVSFIQVSEWREIQSQKYQLREIKYPQITALFFNPSYKQLKNKEVRQALSWLVDKEEIVKDILLNEGHIINGPLPYKTEKKNYRPAKAKQILKKYKKLSFTILTSLDGVQQQVAQRIKSVYEKHNIKVKIQSLPAEEVGMMIQDQKNYQLLLFGQNLGRNLDLFSYWHSSQISEGFNMALYDNPEVDQLLEEIEFTKSSDNRIKLKERTASIIASDYPALFLYNPFYLHLIPADIKGVIKDIQGTSPEDRLWGIENWYLKERLEK